MAARGRARLPPGLVCLRHDSLLGWARVDGVRAGLCACASESAAGQGPAARGPTPRAPVLPSAPIFVVRMPDPGGALDAGRVRFPRPRARRRAPVRAAAATPQRLLLQSYDEGFEFPCLMSHWRTWSTFTTLSAEIGMTIQGFSVT